MNTPMRVETLIKYHSTIQLRDVLREMGHEVDEFETASDLNAYILCLADGSCGDSGQRDYRTLSHQVMIQFH